MHEFLKLKRGFSTRVLKMCKIRRFFLLIMSYLHLYTVMFVLYNITEIYQIMIN